jgi:hypothetical protein
MMTSRRSNAQPRSRAQKFSVKVRRHIASRSRARGKNRRSWFTLLEIGLIVLVVSTAWAITSISVWWIPVYLALIVTIFSTPRPRRSSPSVSNASAGSEGLDTTDLGQGLRVDRADGAEQYHPVFPSNVDVTTVESAESSDSSVGPTGAGITKPRRGRVRVRKVSKPAAELVTDSLPVAWIQVGPGKFVRIEGGVTAANSAQTEEALPSSAPVTEESTAVTTAETAQAQPLEKQESLESLEAPSCDVEPVLVSTDCALVSVTEEYGIAPSAFTLIPQVESASAGLNCVVSDRIDQPEIMAAVPTGSAGRVLPSAVDPGHLWLQPRSRRQWVERVQRGTVHTVLRLDQASYRRSIRARSNPRALAGSWFAPNISRQNAARRAFGRMAHVERTLQPRSPPVRYLGARRIGFAGRDLLRISP